MSEFLDAIREVDSANQVEDVLDLPDHLRDALWRFESAGIEPSESSGLVACGMGGSGVGGALARAALGDRVQRPMIVVRDYEPPSWTLPDHAVLCCSYSGSTEETLACFAAAEAVGARRIVATTGGPLAEQARTAGVPVVGIPSGLQPRAAVGYLFSIAADAAAAVGVAPAIHTDIDAAAAWLDQSQDGLVARAAEIVAEIERSVPVIYGSDLTAPVAYRWKTQVNENAKQHAFQGELPEMDHNEIVGWAPGTGVGRFSAIFLQDSDQHPREHERVEQTARLIEPGAHRVLRVETEGETRTARLLWAVMLGDLVSLGLAAARGIDPTPVETLERIKDALGRQS
ncbi:MAG: bifunctional phosphoglucose/phosphomannose isomerase [bacterium]